MTQEEKLLLLEDLSARLLYNVKFSFNLLDEEKQEVVNTVCTLFSLNTDGYCEALEVSGHIPLEFAKPYLRLWTSMTEKEIKEIQTLLCDAIVGTEMDTISILGTQVLFEYLNKKMIDYRGLIKKGLALEAPEGMYNN